MERTFTVPEWALERYLRERDPLATDAQIRTEVQRFVVSISITLPRQHDLYGRNRCWCGDWHVTIRTGGEV